MNEIGLKGHAVLLSYEAVFTLKLKKEKVNWGVYCEKKQSQS